MRDKIPLEPRQMANAAMGERQGQWENGEQELMDSEDGSEGIRAQGS